MVVIIDDRADVWEWSPNLIKVIPCRSDTIYIVLDLTFLTDDFFIGIGDINSAFLPKINPLTAATPTPPPAKVSSLKEGEMQPPVSPASSDTAVSEASDSTLVDESNELMQKNMLSQNSLALEAQVEERPLAKKQEELEASPSEQSPAAPGAPITPPNETDVKGNSGSKKRNKAPPKALLRNDDFELQRVRNVSLFWHVASHKHSSRQVAERCS